MGFFRDDTSKKAAQKEHRRAIDDIKGIELANLQELQQVGMLNPEMQQNSLLTAYQDDPYLRDAQMQALGSLQETVSGDGLDAQARARINEMQTDIGAAERGSREAILADQRARGLGGSGVELAAQLANQQGAAGRANQAGLDIAAMGEDRKQTALRDLANIGGDIRGQDFKQAQSVAQAQDAINQFNTQNRNVAQQYNLGEAQRVSDYNRAQLPQQQFENQMTKATNLANTRQKKASGDQSNAQTGNFGKQMITSAIGGATQGMGKAGGEALVSSFTSDKSAKENIEPLDVDSFLEELTGYRYNYRNPEKHGDGPQVGVMAQDLERAVPQAVSEDQEGTKRIDYSKLGGPILAALAELNKKIDAKG